MLDTNREPTVILKLRRREDGFVPSSLPGPEVLKACCLDPAASGP